MAHLVKANGLDGLSLQLALHAPNLMYKVDGDLAFDPGDGEKLQTVVDQVVEKYGYLLPMNRDYYRHFGDYVEQPQKLRLHHNAVGFAMVMINPWGDVCPDPLASDSMGNIRQQTFKEIWYGERASAVRRRIATQEHAVSPFDSFVSMNFAMEHVSPLNFHRLLKPIFNGAQHF
jgi:MoaA/NifB/PqqE/SkfB family radical SAM enzyme